MAMAVTRTHIGVWEDDFFCMVLRFLSVRTWAAERPLREF